jgi:hypothetical protein
MKTVTGDWQKKAFALSLLTVFPEPELPIMPISCPGLASKEMSKRTRFISADRRNFCKMESVRFGKAAETPFTCKSTARLLVVKSFGLARLEVLVFPLPRRGSCSDMVHGGHLDWYAIPERLGVWFDGLSLQDRLGERFLLVSLIQFLFRLA